MADTDNLSSVFISRVKILFDILDENHTGFVRLSDIESHWEANDCIIPGNVVIQSLKNMASPTGRLSFDTLVMGLKRALTVWKSSESDPHSSSNENHRSSSRNDVIGTKPTTHESGSGKTDRSSFDSVDHRRPVHRSSAASYRLLKSADAEYNSGHVPVTLRANVDDLKFWHHDRISAGDIEEYAYVQKRKGDQFVFKVKTTGGNRIMILRTQALHVSAHI